ncbi:MAG: flagellar biosynthesis protein FlhA [Myxococcales bacterium]|nr:MAG: flagellar biosynthesis protein FlhA [Myxococcales bacterium]
MFDRLRQLTRQTDIMMAIGVVGIVMMMILPIPAMMMDFMLAISITISLVVLLTTMYVRQPLQFSVFPSILLVLTLFRLSLNIATTRLILIDGHTGPQAAGKVIMAFGQFVVAGNYVVGIIVFLILLIINFVVITKGSGRIAEVAARFVLDSMPGKQMAIDADLNAGLIKDQEARARRKAIADEADFYGAMDGASKFVRGDAIAGLLITAINIIAGLAIGVIQIGLPVGKAAATYTILTVGDGLVSQIPSLITSTAAGILVTRTASEAGLGDDFFRQVLGQWKVLLMVGLFLLVFAVVPGMPTMTFLLLSALLISTALYSRRRALAEAKIEREIKAEAPEEEMTEAERLESMLPLDLLDLEVGYALINLVDAKQGGELLGRITALRRQFISSLGIIVPPIHIRDNLQLEPSQYAILLKGTEIARGSVRPDMFLAMNPGDVSVPIDGEDTVEPAFGLPAKWISKTRREQAEALGYTVVDASTVIATHLSELLKTHAHEIVGRQELQQLLDIFAKSNPKLVEELIPDRMTLGDALKVVKNLLAEQVSVRDMRTILETLADFCVQTKNPEVLAEIVRQRMAKAITARLKSPEGDIYALMFDKRVEDLFRNSQRLVEDEIQVAISPEQAKRVLAELEKKLQDSNVQAQQPVLLVSPEIRKAIRNFLKRFLPDVQVVSHREIDATARIQLVGTISA